MCKPTRMREAGARLCTCALCCAAVAKNRRGGSRIPLSSNALPIASMQQHTTHHKPQKAPRRSTLHTALHACVILTMMCLASSDTSLQGWHMREMSWGSAASQVCMGTCLARPVTMAAMDAHAASTAAFSSALGACGSEGRKPWEGRGGRRGERP